MIYIVYTSQNKLIFEDDELMESFLKHLANHITHIYGGKNRDITIEEVIIKPDNRDPIYKNCYMLTIVLNVLGIDYKSEKLPYGHYYF